MQVHHSKVNFRKLVRDFADMYQDPTFDVVITELVANSLDAQAGEISIDWDATAGILVIADDGVGMDHSTFEDYHDFAAEIKARGHGIGFAGVGAKISFNIANRVLTETQHTGSTLASDWYWRDENELIWVQMEGGRLSHDGTRVEVRFEQAGVPTNVDSDYILDVLMRHYLPLFVQDFMDAYPA